jgi:hypothetical protein
MNELARTQRPERIIDNLIRMHEEVLSHGAKSLAVTLPEHGQEVEHGWIRSARQKINQELKEFCDRTGVPFVDMERLMPKLANDRFWADSAHLTEEGYDEMAQCILIYWRFYIVL